MEEQCQHQFEHLETLKSRKSEGYNSYFKKVDRFFCVRCLDSKETIKETTTRDTPDWY